MRSPTVTDAAPDPAFIASLPGTDFSDAFTVVVPRGDLDARAVAALAFSSLPDWAGWLIKIRNLAMRPFGLKTDEIMQGLPVLQEGPTDVVVGVNDDHLDFRTQFRTDTIRLGPDGPHLGLVTVTTVVRTHNRLGRIYLAAVMPIHKLVVRSLLARVAGKLMDSAT
ncbi:DUF2867 domain-containing protein [Ferrovibrio sp.]|uniref:DUF2867 domain-containing protein n=1 Tax=Ferrovibrio sp. TaxID=1917215 RepID=UPI000CB63520|nr:DUF2867 domain-containing protein [Ferrovibrio sp.]PJI41047.1 MAG: hypothetical protein CTR53_09085 [Ferrovibrio sp.]